MCTPRVFPRKKKVEWYTTDIRLLNERRFAQELPIKTELTPFKILTIHMTLYVY